jgi:polyisoprenyl-phosphate glycosyltransferase
MKKISVVIPFYNEVANIQTLYSRLVEVFEKLAYEPELIFVNDGSHDASMDVIRHLSSDKRLKCIVLNRNFGHQNALSAGLDFANGDAVISMDCDLQDPPEIIPEMIQQWENGYDVVYARRKNYRNDNIFKKVLSVIYYKILDKAKDVDIPKNVGDFRLIDKKVLVALSGMKERSRFLRGMVAWLGYKCAFVDFTRPDRKGGKSGYSFMKLIKLGMDGLLNFSLLPFKLGLIIGIISIFIGGGILIYMVLDILINNVYYHLYKFLVDAIFIFMGFLFILVWILGEYIGRLMKETKARPVYIVDEKINIGPDENPDSKL